MFKNSAIYTIVSVIFYFTSILFSETITNGYSSNLVKVFESSFEEYEGNGGFVDSSVCWYIFCFIC